MTKYFDVTWLWFLNVSFIRFFIYSVFYLYVLSCDISVHDYLDNTPPKLVQSLVSDPGGGGVLHLVSEHEVY